MDITVQQARSFLAVSDELNFTRAARRLHVSPSSLSELITTVERRLGRKLFERNSRQVTLTEAGREFRPLAIRLCEAADAVGDWAAQRVQTVIRVGLTASSSRFRAVLTAVADELPQVDWRVRHLPFAQAYTALAEGTVDCVFTAESDPGMVSETVEAIAVWDEAPVVILSDTHPLATRGELGVDDLAGQTLITADDEAMSQRWLAGVRPGGLAPTLRPIASSLDEVLDLCGAGLGVNIAGAGVTESYAREGIRFIPLRDLAPRTIYLCLRREAHGAELTQFVRLAARGMVHGD